VRPDSWSQQGACRRRSVGGMRTARGEFVIREIVLRSVAAPGEQYHLHRAQLCLRRELGSDAIRTVSCAVLPEVGLSLGDWQNPRANVLGFDRLLESVRRQGDFRLVLGSKRWLYGVQPALQILNRYQRFMPMPGNVVALPQLSRVLDAHSAAFSGRPPTALARSLDVWRWTLRLGREPSAPVQLAALFGELPTEPESPGKSGTFLLHTYERVGSARAAEDALKHLGLQSTLMARTAELIASADVTPKDAERALLSDARDVSFFSLGSWAYLRDHGPVATERHVHALLGRMGDVAVCLSRMTRQPPEIRDMIERHFESAPALPLRANA